MTITLKELAARLGSAERVGDATVTDATHDSRQVRPGWLFCAIPGAVTDGHRFADQALDGGAAALLVERWVDADVPQLRVPDVRAALGPAAAAVHGDPSRTLTVVGVTGTNGKTTTTYLLEAAFGAAGWGTGVIGTVQTRIHGAAQPGVRTTPEATDLQRLLRKMVDRGVDAVSIEASSHGLALRRVDGTRFAVAVFTNLTQDHLDFHDTMEGYYRAKARLFTPDLADRGLVCIDDEWGRRLADEATVPVQTFGRHPDADHRILSIRADLDGTTADVLGPDGTTTVRTRLLGTVNAVNAVAAQLAAVAAGVPPEAATQGVAACAGVPGRLERVDAGRDVAVLVDYAHTPDALEHAVSSVRALVPEGRVHVVVGCGGDRDRGKRPLMGAVAASADRAVLTSDNPRSEDPDDILDQMYAGVPAGRRDRVQVVVDRRAAIGRALDLAAAGDVVLVAGKGHETGQEFADRVVPFDDRIVAREELARRHPGEVSA